MRLIAAAHSVRFLLYETQVVLGDAKGRRLLVFLLA